MKVSIKLLRSSAVLPSFATEGSAGMDLSACFDVISDIKSSEVVDLHEEAIFIRPGQAILIPTGISLSMPTNMEAQVRPRSGLALKKGLTVLNSPGTIDSDYRGEIGVIIINHSNEKQIIKKGERIAQLVFAEVCRPAILEVIELDQTARAEGGFGSTGE